MRSTLQRRAPLGAGDACRQRGIDGDVRRDRRGRGRRGNVGEDCMRLRHPCEQPCSARGALFGEIVRSQSAAPRRAVPAERGRSPRSLAAWSMHRLHGTRGAVAQDVALCCNMSRVATRAVLQHGRRIGCAVRWQSRRCRAASVICAAAGGCAERRASVGCGLCVACCTGASSGVSCMACVPIRSAARLRNS